MGRGLARGFGDRGCSLVLALAACQFDSGGIDTDGPGVTTPSPTDDSGSTSDGSTDDGGSTGSGSTTDEPSTGDTTSCDPTVPDTLVFIEDATVMNLELLESLTLPPQPDGDTMQYGRSFVANTGSATFTIAVDCDTVLSVWALVWDADGGSTDHADSFLVAVDRAPAAEEPIWPYGCQSSHTGGAWRWQRLALGDEATCTVTALELELAAGTHRVTLTNREAVGPPPPNNDFAGLAALAWSSNLTFQPTSLYDPEDAN